MSPAFQRDRGRAADLTLYAADIGHDCAGGEVRGNLPDQRADLVHRSADDDQLDVAHGVGGGVGHAIAPRLAFQLQAGLGPAGPEGEALRGAQTPGRLRDGGTEQAGSEDGNLVKHDPSEKAPRQIVEPASANPVTRGRGAGYWPPSFPISANSAGFKGETDNRLCRTSATMFRRAGGGWGIWEGAWCWC